MLSGVESFRVSKTHGHTNACLRKTIWNLLKMLTLERKTCKTCIFSFFGAQFEKGFQILHVFYSNFSAHVCAKLYQAKF